MITQETQVANVANTIIMLAAQANALATQIVAVSTQWANLSVANKLDNFPTAAVLATGALGTADTLPVTTNPIDVRVSPGSDIVRAISASDIASVLTGLEGVQSAIGGGAVAANGALVQLFALCV
jgi:hypothetical protein